MTHSFKIHFFHLIWSTKLRAPLITPEIQTELYPYMGGVIKNLNGTLLEIGGMPDHIHLLINLANLDQYSTLIQKVKTHSTLWINKKFPAPQKFSWQEGFASVTVNYSLVETVRKYIKNQEEHHKTVSFEQEYINFLKSQNINYDPRFVLG